MTHTITFDEARALVQVEIAKEGPDFAYIAPGAVEAGIGTCVYVTKDGTPSCLVGRVLVAGGVPLETVAWLDHQHTDEDGEYGTASVAIDSVEAQDMPLSYKAREYLLNVQQAQDRGTPWVAADRDAFLQVVDIDEDGAYRG